MSPVVTEIIGYIASALVAGSLLMVSFVKLRLINLSGAVFFVVYGALIGSIPIIITNGFIACVNIYHLLRIFRSPSSGFSYIRINESRRTELDRFISEYQEDILAFYPSYSDVLLNKALRGDGSVYLALKKLRVVGFAFYTSVPQAEELEEDELLRIMDYVRQNLYPEKSVFMPVDYIVKKYRDLGLVGKLHKKLEADLFPQQQFILFVSEKANRKNHRFLTRNGHAPVKDFERYRLYVKTIGYSTQE